MGMLSYGHVIVWVCDHMVMLSYGHVIIWSCTRDCMCM